MSLEQYWPKEEFIAQCIRTEAEELPEQVLLAVHEPMNLQRVGLDTDDSLTEQDLLAEFLNSERPIPIVARSGMGKSHLIRWLHAQLKLLPECRDWHIVRIPKNASLRQVLEILLRGLDGEIFEKARQDISTVGEQFSTKNVADLLLIFMSQRLEKMSEAAALSYKEITQNPGLKNTLGKEDIEKLKRILKHTGKDKTLASLITDPNFKKRLLEPEHCIYKIAERLTVGAKQQDLSETDYELKASDLDFTYNISELSLPARDYVEAVRLNSVLQVRKDAAQILNDVLSEANKVLFRQLFSFSSGSFVDLFKEIRRSLKQKNQTLVVLVEDMAAISAIEDVLIDSLLEESITDGKQELCILRSAIAVTDGYAGYLSRQETIKTRARYEWHIRDQVEEGESLNQRIVEFVARYLNAARFGQVELYQKWKERDELSASSWPLVWKLDDVDELLNAFGESPQLKIPLFPFNQNAILALAYKFCTDAGQLKFNPRQILNQIVLRVLKNNKVYFEEQKFPYAQFAEMSISPNISSHLGKFNDISRCISVAAIWGYESRSMDELANRLDYRIVQGFGIEDFARYLQNYKPTGEVFAEKNIVPSASKTESVPSRIQNSKVIIPKNRLQLEFERIDRMLEQWLQPKGIMLDQKIANILRQELEQMFSRYLIRDKYSFNITGDIAKKIKSGVKTYIEIPNAHGNLTGNILSFFDSKDLKNPNRLLEIQAISSALLRNHAAKKEGVSDWSYSGGYNDLLVYQNFAMHWVHSSMMFFMSTMRQQAEALIKEQIELAYQLGVWRNKGSDTQQKKLEALLLKQSELDYFGKTPLLKGLQVNLINWDNRKAAWLNLFANNDHIYEGKNALAAFRTAEKKVVGFTVFAPIVPSIESEIRSNLIPLLQKIQCSTYQEYSDMLNKMIQNIQQVSMQGKYYPKGNTVLDADSFVQLIKPLNQEKNAEDSESWKMIKNILQLSQEVTAEEGVQWDKVVAYVQCLDVSSLDRLKLVIRHWEAFYKESYFKIKQDNDSNGQESLDKEHNYLEGLFTDLEQILERVMS